MIRTDILEILTVITAEYFINRKQNRKFVENVKIVSNFELQLWKEFFTDFIAK